MSERVVDSLLAARAAAHPDRAFLRFRDETLTVGEADREATSLAHGLTHAGISRGDVVVSLLPNCGDAAILPFAVPRAGAVHAPINTAFRGRVLSHVVGITEATVLILDDGLVDAIEDVAGDLEIDRVYVRGDIGAAAERLPRFEVRPLDDLRSDDESPIPSPGTPADLAWLLFTSGTTGRSKACMLSHRFAVQQAELLIEGYELRADDVLYSPYPLFHLDALGLTVLPALLLGTTAALGERFSASGFWDEVRHFEATVFDFMGATLTMLHKAPRATGDADNPARLAWGVPVPEFAPAFEERFGLRVVELYGSTDAGLPVYQPLHEPRVPGSCGRAIDCYEVRIVGDDREPLPDGEIGEIAIRGREPGLLTDGYYGMPEETEASRHDGWFLTGDLARRDADGNFFFVGRRKEAIRRRGENISAFEVEEVLLDHPDVLDVAAYGVPSELSEEEVMVAVVPRPGRSIDHDDLIAHCTRNMARYMVPRYVDVLAALPLTPTQKVEKYRLQERGVTATTWDRLKEPPG